MAQLQQLLPLAAAAALQQPPEPRLRPRLRRATPQRHLGGNGDFEPQKTWEKVGLHRVCFGANVVIGWGIMGFFGANHGDLLGDNGLFILSKLIENSEARVTQR